MTALHKLDERFGDEIVNGLAMAGVIAPFVFLAWALVASGAL